MSDKDNFVEMGFCKKPHGIKGEFQFNLHNPENSSLKKGSVIKLTPFDSHSSIDKNGTEFKIQKIQFGNKIICLLEDVDNRNLVEAMIPFTIFISRDQFQEPDGDEIFLSDLVGLIVLNTSNEEVGKVENYYDHGAQPVLVIKMNIGDNVELPFVEAFFPEVDIENNTIVMIDPEVV
jgi:16S rRNA processing protein RimM